MSKLFRIQCVKRDIFAYKNHINNKFQPGKLNTFEKTTKSNKAPHKQQEIVSKIKELDEKHNH